MFFLFIYLFLLLMRARGEVISVDVCLYACEWGVFCSIFSHALVHGVQCSNVLYLIYYFYFNSRVNVTEVAHDYQVSVKKYMTEDLGIIKSYDTWHGKYKYEYYYNFISIYMYNCKELKTW